MGYRAGTEPYAGTGEEGAAKCTLCFSLAVNVCRHFGIKPVERVELKDEEVGHYIEDPMHLRLARQLAMRAGKGSRVTDSNE